MYKTRKRDADEHASSPPRGWRRAVLTGVMTVSTAVLLVLAALLVKYGNSLATFILVVVAVGTLCLLWSVRFLHRARDEHEETGSEEHGEPDPQADENQEETDVITISSDDGLLSGGSRDMQTVPVETHHEARVPPPVDPTAWSIDRFPSPTGNYSPASRMPWRLPAELSPPGLVADCARVGYLEVRAASIVGPMHRCEEPATARQDAYRIGRDAEGQYLVVAVIDGMSDSCYSHLGANVAAAALVGEVLTALDQGMAPEALDAVKIFLEAARQMSGAAAQRGIGDMEVRSAALAAVISVSPDPAGRRRIWLASVGDVSAWRRCAAGWQQLVGKEKSGMDPNVLDEFLPYHPYQAIGNSFWLGEKDVLALTTDGIADVLGPPGRAAAWFASRWQYPPHIASFILDVGYEAKTQTDDRTAVVLWCDVEEEYENMVR